jgi:hypothetical protein
VARVIVLELVGLSVAGCMLDMNVARVEILVQQAAGAKTLELFGCANVRGERVFDRRAHHASDSVDDVSEARM